MPIPLSSTPWIEAQGHLDRIVAGHAALVDRISADIDSWDIADVLTEAVTQADTEFAGYLQSMRKIREDVRLIVAVEQAMDPDDGAGQ